MYVTSSSPIPLYYQLREQIREKIISEEWPFDFEIPTELYFCETLHLSRATVRQAIDDLVNESMLVRMRGKGTYVIYQKTNNFLTEPSFKKQVEQLGLATKTKLIASQPEQISKKLALSTGSSLEENVLHLKRLRYIQERETVIDHNYVMDKFKDKLRGADLEKESIYQYLPYDKCSVSIRPVLLNLEEKKLLNVIEEGDATTLPALGMLVEIMSYLDCEPVMLTKRCYRGDYCHLNIEYSLKSNGNELDSSAVVIKK